MKATNWRIYFDHDYLTAVLNKQRIQRSEAEENQLQSTTQLMRLQKTLKDRGSPVKAPPWILWSSWSSKHGASRERTNPRAAAETSSRSAEGNLLIRTKIIVKGSYRQKVCTSHPAVLSLFTSRSWWLASLKVRGGDLNIHLNPKQTGSNKTTGTKVKELMEDMGLIGAPYSTHHSSYIRIDQRRDRSRTIESDVGTVDLSECALINTVVD